MRKNNYLIFGISLLIIGIITIVGKAELFRNISNIVMIIMFIISIKDLISFLSKKENKLKLITKIINVFLCLLAYIFNEYSVAIIPLLFSIYSIMNGIIGLINFIIIKINKLKGGFREFYLTFIYISVGIIVFLEPLIHLNFVLSVLGIYSILLGISFIFDYLDFNNYGKYPKIKITLPSIVEAFIPISALKKSNIKDQIKKIEKTDLEIIIHVTENGYGRLGHLDICYKDEIISFGNYDTSSYKFHDLLGNGILFTTKNKKEYFKFCINDNKKTLFVFGIKLTDKEKIIIEENILNIKNQLKEWYPPVIKRGDSKDYSSRLYKCTKANFYKFKSGKYRVYFVLGNNCVTIANKIVGRIIKDYFKLYGVLTPGTYYEYLEKEYKKNNSKVVWKKIYSKYNIDELN